MNLLVTMQAYNSILKIIYFLIIRKESKFSRLKRALKENIDDAFTVSGVSEFHTSKLSGTGFYGRRTSLLHEDVLKHLFVAGA